MTLTELVFELNDEIKKTTPRLSQKVCLNEIRSKVPGASRMTNLQLLLVAMTVSSKREFQEKVFLEFLDPSETVHHFKSLTHLPDA